MSTEKNTPPAIAPKVVAPRPDTPGRPKPTTPPPPPPEENSPGDVPEEPGDGMERSSGESKVAVARDGAVKTAKAAMAAAKTARKKAAPEGKREKTSATANPMNEDTVPAESTPHVPITPPAGPGVSAMGGPASPVGPQAGATMHYSMGAASGVTTVMEATPEVSAPGTAGPAENGTAAAKSAREESAPRKVRLTVSKVNPWSVMKLAFLLSVGIGIMLVVAIIVFWLILDGMHVFTKVDDFIQQVVGDAAKVDVLQFVEFSKVVSYTLIIAVVNMLLTTALATIMAFLYNVTSSLVGGLHVTLTDD